MGDNKLFKLMKMKKYLFIAFFFCCLFGCKRFVNDGQFMNSASHSLKDLRKLIIEQGDTAAYYELSIQYLDLGMQDFLVYALIMANKFDYPQAYFDVFDCITYEYIDNYELIDEKTAALAIEYLIKAANMGHEQAQKMVKESAITTHSIDNVTQIKRLYE